MNFIIKTIIKKVFQKYLNLEQQLNVESGLIKLPFGTINHEQVNKKLEPFSLKISSSIYKNLSISIPLTQIVSKPIKISIQRFQVTVGKTSRQTRKTQQKKEQQEKDQKQASIRDKLQIDKEVQKISKNKQLKKQQVNSGYIKNMVNRLLYNMEVIIEKVVIKMDQDQEEQSAEGLQSYLSKVQFQITHLHLRNSLVLLQANIIKKIFNLQQVRISHKIAQLVVRDFNICLDYNNNKINVIAILGKIIFSLNQIPMKLIQKSCFNQRPKSELNPPPTKNSNHSDKKRQNQKPRKNLPNQKSIELNIYSKINQCQFYFLNLFSVRGQSIQLKYKNWNQNYNSVCHVPHKNTEAQVLFKNVCFVHRNEEPVQQKDFLMIRYLPWCDQVKTFAQYQDNILKSSIFKYTQKLSTDAMLSRNLHLTKNQVQVNSSTSFEYKAEEVQREAINKRSILFQLYYVDLMIDIQVIKQVLQKIIRKKQFKTLVSWVKLYNLKAQNTSEQGQHSRSQVQCANQKQKQVVQVEFIIYRLMINARLLDDTLIKIYGSFNGEYTKQKYFSDNSSLIEQSVSKYPVSKDSFTSEHNRPVGRRHVHKKRFPNKQRHYASQVQLQKGAYKPKSQLYKKSSDNLQTAASQVKINERFRLRLIQLCVQCRQYLIMNLGTFQLELNRNKSQGSQVVISGTSLNSELSIKLIKDMQLIVPLIENDVKQIVTQIKAFFNTNNIPSQLQEIISKQKDKQKTSEKMEKVSVFLKLNQLNLKFGSLIKQPNANLRGVLRKESFIWIFLLQLSNISFGIKNLKNFKFKCSLMLFITSPQTLHKDSLSNLPVDIQVDCKSNKQIQIQLKNDFSVNLDENIIQILLKYFGQLDNQNNKIKRSQVKLKQNQQKQGRTNQRDLNTKQLFDNECYFVQFYNATFKPISFIQVNQYGFQEDSMNLSQFQQGLNVSDTHDHKFEEKSISIEAQNNLVVFWLNQDYFTVTVDGFKSKPIYLDFSPSEINYTKINPNSYCFEHEVLVQFEEQNLKVQHKYVIQFLFNSISKIQKIVFKYNVVFISYKNPVSIVHTDSSLVALSNLVIQNSKQKITQNYLINCLRNNHIELINLDKTQDLSVNYEFLLDLNQQSKNIVFLKTHLIKKNQASQEKLKQSKYKVSNLLMRSPNNKIQSNSYSLFGVFAEKQYQKANPNNKVSEIITHRLFQNYLYQIKHLHTTYFISMPFLIVENNLCCEIQLQIFDKKAQITKTLKLQPQQKKDLYPASFQTQNGNNFDYYNKQFTMKIRIVSTAINYLQSESISSRQAQKQVIYQSQEHYFNTFFMVEHEFQTLIALRSNKKYQFDKKYLFLRQQLMLKTKVIKLEPSCQIINKTNFNFGLKFRKTHQNLPFSSGKPIQRPRNNQNIPQTNLQNLTEFIMLPQEQQNNYFISKKATQTQTITQLRTQQVLEVLFQNLEQTKIQIKQEHMKDGSISILSFNFAQKDKISNQSHNKHIYCHLLFRLRIKNIQNRQLIIIQNFVTLKNLSLQKISVNLQPNRVIQENEQVCLPLPPTANAKFNNRLITLSNINQIQALYQEIFSFSLDEKSKTQLRKKMHMQKGSQVYTEGNNQNPSLIIKSQDGGIEQAITFKQLIFSKNSAKQVNLNKRGTKLFSLLKDLKCGIIHLYFIQKLFNPNISYLILQNNTKKNFLLSSDKSQYTHHFVKASTQKSSTTNNQSKQNIAKQTTEKIFINEESFSIMPNKQNFQLFFCDQNGKHLQKSTKQKLERQGLQMEFHTTGNFQLVDIQQSSKHGQKDQSKNSSKPKLSFKTHLISININLYSKLSLSLCVSKLSLRLLEQHKIDFLIEDISVKNSLTNQHILRVPQESYVLLEGKMVGTERSSSFILVKNLFVKCKNVILNIEKDLPYRLICLIKNLLPQTQTARKEGKPGKSEFDHEFIRSYLQNLQANQSLNKLGSYLKQKLFLVKNIYLHQIHLSLSLDLQNNNFSNVMVIPNYELVNSFMRQNNLFKEIGQFYKTNILAKLPKLSFIFQNLKNPLNLFRTVVKVGSALYQKIELKNILTFYHDQIPQNNLQFSLQRWNVMHKQVFSTLNERKQIQNRSESLLTYLYKSQFYYIVSNLNFIILSLNSKNLPKDAQNTLVHYESSSQEIVGLKSRDRWVKTYENSMMKIIPLKDLQKLKLIRNKKYSQFVIQFKRNLNINILDQYQKCSKLIDTINSIVM